MEGREERLKENIHSYLLVKWLAICLIFNVERSRAILNFITRFGLYGSSKFPGSTAVFRSIL